MAPAPSRRRRPTSTASTARGRTVGDLGEVEARHAARIEREQVAGVDEPAADHDDLGIEQVDEVGQAERDPPGELVAGPPALRGRPAGAGGDHVLAAHGLGRHRPARARRRGPPGDGRGGRAGRGRDPEA